MKDQIRQAVLNSEGAQIRELLLAESQVSLLWEIIDNALFTTEKLAAAINVSIPNASSKLNRLYKAGYLGRTDRTAESGGIEFVYSIPAGLKGSMP